MRVKCIYDSSEKCPQLKTKNNVFADAIEYITLGKEYTVYAIAKIKSSPHKPHASYLIICDFGKPALKPVWLFEVLDSNMGDAEWHFRHYVENDLPGLDKNFIEYVLGYEELASEDLKHIFGLFHGNEEDERIFQKWREIIDMQISK